MFTAKLMPNASNPVEMCSLVANPNLQIFAKAHLLWIINNIVNNIHTIYMTTAGGLIKRIPRINVDLVNYLSWSVGIWK